MEFIHFLHPEAKTTRDGHAQPAVSAAFGEIVNAMHSPSRKIRADFSPLAALLIENLGEKCRQNIWDQDILGAAGSMQGYGNREAYQPDASPQKPTFVGAFEDGNIQE